MPPDRSPVSPADLNWLAGIIDGEGNFHATYNKRKDGSPGLPHIVLQIGNSNWEMIKRVKRILWELNGHRAVAHERDNKHHPTWKRFWVIRLSRRSHLKPVLQALVPLLTAKRKPGECALRIVDCTREQRRMMPGHREYLMGLADRIKFYNQNPPQPDAPAPETGDGAPEGESTVQAPEESGMA